MSKKFRVTNPAVSEAPPEAIQALARDHVDNLMEAATQESQRDRTAMTRRIDDLIAPTRSIDYPTPFPQPITSAGDGVAHPVAGRTQGSAHPLYGEFAPPAVGNLSNVPD